MSICRIIAAISSSGITCSLCALDFISRSDVSISFRLIVPLSSASMVRNWSCRLLSSASENCVVATCCSTSFFSLP